VAALSISYPGRMSASTWRGRRTEPSAEVRIGAREARPRIAPDAAICAACAAEVVDPSARRYRYPFATCACCGPRLTIATGRSDARAATTMAGFPPCDACRAEYDDPADRRFHAEAIACPACGPQVRLIRIDGAAGGVGPRPRPVPDELDAACGLLAEGEIIAIKGLGGYHLACDATRAEVVQRLRERKRCGGKPFPLMARDLDAIRRYCTPGAAEIAALAGAEAPIVLLAADGPERLPDAVAPGLPTLGFMLPATPLHALIARGFEHPLVMTSGNLSEEPPVTRDEEVALRLGGIASHALVHDRPIAHRVDDSVVRVMLGAPRVVRRARGFAPAPIGMPPGFERAPGVLACGGDAKATFCIIARGEAVLSPHQGDLGDPATLDDYLANLERHAALLEHVPSLIAIDRHPDSHAGRLARARAGDAIPLARVQHHHAHVAACLLDNGRPLDAPRVLGVVLDGAGLGDDGASWGGEFLLADYTACERLGTFKPVAMLGGERAAIEPWRNLYAHLVAELGWPVIARSFGELPLIRRLDAKPRALLDAMLANRLNTPLASSCGRLFDAVAAAVELAFERQAYDGEAPMKLEAAVDRAALDDPDAYPFAIPKPADGLPYLEPLAMWWALLEDLARRTPAGVIAARFHRALARGVADMADELRRRRGFDTVALSGGCFQNRVLLEQCERLLGGRGYRVLSHARIPPNDGGLSAGQAAVAAARLLAGRA
jgi:hydrogenase maturation protein HypF